MGVTLEIPDDVAQAMRVPDAELPARMRLELAVSLYAQGILGLGKAAELAGLRPWELNVILAKRGVAMHYTREDLAEDVAYGAGRQ